MSDIKKIIYWHRFGLKTYSVADSGSLQIEKEIETRKVEEIIEGLKFLSGKNVYLLLSDSISYLFEKTIDPPLEQNDGFKEKLLALIKPEIPEDFTEFDWDYKLEHDPNGSQKVIVFAPLKEYQVLIGQVAKALDLNIIAIETESVSATRDPNPVIGIIKKTDLKGKDEEVLNISLEGEKKPKNWLPLTIGGAVLVMAMAIFFVVRSGGVKENKVAESSPTPTIAEEITSPTPTEAEKEVKKWQELKVAVMNGTQEAGKASKKAALIKDAGIEEVASSNADSDTYEENKLVFKDEFLKEKYLERLLEIIPVEVEQVSVDTGIEYDAIFILGKR